MSPVTSVIHPVKSSFTTLVSFLVMLQVVKVPFKVIPGDRLGSPGERELSPPWS